MGRLIAAVVACVLQHVHGSRQLGFTSQGNLVPTLDGGLTFRASLFNPFPDGIPEPVGAELGPNTNVGGTLARFYDDIDYKNGQAICARFRCGHGISAARRRTSSTSRS